MLWAEHGDQLNYRCLCKIFGSLLTDYPDFRIKDKTVEEVHYYFVL